MYPTTVRARVAAAGIAIALAVSACASAPSKDPALYHALGGREGIARLVDALLVQVFADERISPLFAANTPEELAPLVADQICEAAGGPCVYRGRSMVEAHTGLGITDAQFGAFVEDLGVAMDSVGLGADTQRALVALLAPMKPEIVGQ